MTLETADAGAVAPANDPVLPATETTEAASLDDTLSAAYDRISKAPERSVNGQFVAKDAKAKTEQTPPETAAAEGAEKVEGETTESTDQPEDTATETAKAESPKSSIDPPMSWSADVKAKWATLPSDVQAYVAQRDKETHEAITRIGTEKKSLEDRVKANEPLDQLIAAHKDDFAKRGVAPVQAVAVLLDAQKRLDQNPVAGLVQIAQTYGYTPQAFVDSIFQLYRGQQNQQGDNGAAPPRQDPEVMRLRSELEQIKSSVTEQQKATQQAQKAERERAEAALTSQIADFAKDKPYFNDVEPDVDALIPAMRAKHPDASPLDVLSKAYDAAIWANASVRERILSDQRKKDEDARKEAAIKKANDAKKSASVNVRSGEAGKTNPKSYTETIEETAARLYGT